MNPGINQVVFRIFLGEKLLKKPTMEKLYNWIFTYNPFIEKWQACRDEDYNEMKNDHSSEKVIRSSSQSTLVELIVKGGGNLELIKALVK